MRDHAADRELLETTDEARATVDEARADLERFDRVLGSAEAIGDAVGGRVARTTFSSPMIKAAGFARGTSRTIARLRGGSERTSTPVDRRSRRAADAIESGRHRSRRRKTSMMKRVTWFAGGVVAGARLRRVRQEEGQGDRIADRAGAGREVGCRHRPAQDERRGRCDPRGTAGDEAHRGRTPRPPRRSSDVARRARRPGDQVYVDGVPVESGRVYRDARRRSARRRGDHARSVAPACASGCGPIRCATGQPRSTCTGTTHPTCRVTRRSCASPRRPTTCSRSCGSPTSSACRSCHGVRAPVWPGERCRRPARS